MGYIIDAKGALDNWHDGLKQVEKERAFDPKRGEAYDLAVEIALAALDGITTMDEMRRVYDASDFSLTPALEAAEERCDVILSITVLEDYLFFTKGSQLIQAAADAQKGDD